LFKGTLIRLFNTSSGEQISEVRRGADSAIISHIQFDAQSKIFSVCSEKGTIHLFLVDPKVQAHIRIKPEVKEEDQIEYQAKAGEQQ
jgi:hypothetical protein